MPALSPTPPAAPKPTARYSIPTSIQVATSASPRNDDSEASAFSALNSAAEARALATGDVQLLMQRLALIESLLEPSSPLALVRSGLTMLDGTSWSDLLEERHHLSLCPYPTCARPSSTPYAPDEQPKLRLRLAQNGLVAGGARGKHGAFCSARCRARAEWYREMLGTERTEMLEDVEERRRAVEVGTREIVERASAGASASTRDAVDALPTGALTITERPTPATLPTAPSPTSKIDFERPTTASDTPLSLSRPPRPTRLAPSSASALMPFDTAHLANTVLRSTSARVTPTRPQPTEGINGLPPPQWRSGPVMLDSAGRQVEWAPEEEGTEEEQMIMDEGWQLMRELRGRGEL